MGQTEKSSCHELRQVEQIDQTVLQKGNYEKDGTIATSRLSVLSPLQSVRWIGRVKRSLIKVQSL